MKALHWNWRRIDLSACRYYFTFLGRSVPSVPSVCNAYVIPRRESLLHPSQDFNEKYRVCNIVCNRHTRDYLSLGDQFPSFEIYYTCLSHSMPWTREKWTKTNRPLRRSDVELYSNERQIAITFPKERRYLLLRDSLNL